MISARTTVISRLAHHPSAGEPLASLADSPADRHARADRDRRFRDRLAREACNSRVLRRWDRPVRSGSPASELYLINSGEAEVVGVDVVLGQGDIVGEIGMFTDTNSHGADVRSLTDVEALRISRQTMMELYHRDPAIALQMTRLIVGRLTSA